MNVLPGMDAKAQVRHYLSQSSSGTNASIGQKSSANSPKHLLFQSNFSNENNLLFIF